VCFAAAALSSCLRRRRVTVPVVVWGVAAASCSLKATSASSLHWRAFSGSARHMSQVPGPEASVLASKKLGVVTSECGFICMVARDESIGGRLGRFLLFSSSCWRQMQFSTSLQKPQCSSVPRPEVNADGLRVA
jgi:hypothetical protein